MTARQVCSGRWPGVWIARRTICAELDLGAVLERRRAGTRPRRPGGSRPGRRARARAGRGRRGGRRACASRSTRTISTSRLAAASRYGSIAYGGSTIAATPASSSPTRYDAQPRSSSRNCWNSTDLTLSRRPAAREEERGDARARARAAAPTATPTARERRGASGPGDAGSTPWPVTSTDRAVGVAPPARTETSCCPGSASARHTHASRRVSAPTTSLQSARKHLDALRPRPRAVVGGWPGAQLRQLDPQRRDLPCSTRRG